MYNNYTQPLGKLIVSLVILYHLYADDGQLMRFFDPRKLHQDKIAADHLEHCINEIAMWMFNNKLRLNQDKTEFLILSNSANRRRISVNKLNLNDGVIDSTPSVRNLGVHMDSSLSLEIHIGYIQKTCYFYLNWIRRIRIYLTKDTAKSLVHALVIARIDYCNSIYVNLPKSTTNRLQRIMRCAARVVALPRYGESVTTVCKELHWLPIAERAQFKVLCLVYKSIHGSSPGYLSELITPYVPNRELRSGSSHLLCVRKCRIKYGERAFSHAGPTLWNTLPLDIRITRSIQIFKRKLKTFLFRKAYC